MMKAPYQILVMLSCACVSAFAQPPHQLPFASANNTIELAIHNSSTVTVSRVKVCATNVPAWVRFTSTEQTINQLEGKEEANAAFSFSVDKTAPINKPQALTFTITSSTGEKWTKQISIAVNPPDHFELFQNYPNPFNPTTHLQFTIADLRFVELKVFDILGQEVATLVSEKLDPASYTVQWNASSVASGVYIYQLGISNEEGKKEFYRKKMMVMK